MHLPPLPSAMPCPHVLESPPFPIPQLAGVPADGTLGLRRLSVGLSRPPVPQPGCIGAWVLVIGSLGGGGGRRRRQSLPHHGGHRPRWGAGDTPDNMHLHRSTGPTPRTAGATDCHHAANLADVVPCRATTASTSLKGG
jgi:hypothetical protein